MDASAGQPRRVQVGFDRLERWLSGFRERHGSVEVTRDGDALLLTGSDGDRAWIQTPWLLRTEGARSCADTPGHAGASAQDLSAQLLAHVHRRHRVGVLLVRRGGYAVGIFDGTELVASKVGSSYVQGTTRAGGWSQQRYARRRANQAASAFGTAADVAARILLPEHHRLQALVRGGDRGAVEAVLADRRLAPLTALPTGPLLAVPDPRLRVLQASSEQFRVAQILLVP